MTDLASVPTSSPDPDEQLALFEGQPVQRSRIAPGSIGEFACIDENNETLVLHEGDVVVLQVEVHIEAVTFGAGYKGAVQTKPRARTHHGKVWDGTQQIVAVRRRGE